MGFQPELSARDNVYLYGAIMGLSRREVERRYEEIMDFAELRRFENMKLRNFSSGMYVRLAFATAIQTNPDVLLVDEVLSVGTSPSKRSVRRRSARFAGRARPSSWSHTPCPWFARYAAAACS